MTRGICWTCSEPDVERIESHCGDGITRWICADCADERTRDQGSALAVVAVCFAVFIAVCVAYVVLTVR